MITSNAVYEKLNSIISGLHPAARVTILTKERAAFDVWRHVVDNMAVVAGNLGGYSVREFEAIVVLIEEAANRHVNEMLSLGDGVDGVSRKKRRAISSLYEKYGQDTMKLVHDWVRNIRIVVTNANAGASVASAIAEDELSDLLN